MYSLRSKNQKLNSYINSFIDSHYQPIKMLTWRILLLLIFCSLAIIGNYQHYGFYVEYWFNCSPILVIIAGILTLNFQSLIIGSMCYQYRHHDTAFQIARKFADIEYSPLISGIERKLYQRKQFYRKLYFIFSLLLIGLLSLIAIKETIWLTFIVRKFKYTVTVIYVVLACFHILAAIIVSISIIVSKKQVELIELSLFWLKSASALKYIE